ncbi:HAMP domain-containing protein, partial [Patescibacteria group bacterium]|nr:HAMP domain-containing protein [Patescibacteria group bacterium]
LIMIKGADIIGRGDLTHRIIVNNKGEIGQLSVAFNQMAERLEKLKNELDKKVEERTKELQSKMAELEKVNKLMIGREMKMVELKKQIESNDQENENE